MSRHGLQMREHVTSIEAKSLITFHLCEAPLHMYNHIFRKQGQPSPGAVGVLRAFAQGASGASSTGFSAGFEPATFPSRRPNTLNQTPPS